MLNKHLFSNPLGLLRLTQGSQVESLFLVVDLGLFCFCLLLLMKFPLYLSDVSNRIKTVYIGFLFRPFRVPSH